MSLADRDHRRMTAEEFFVATDGLPRAQLIDGELVIVDSPAARHNRIIFWFVHQFMTFTEANPGVGELGAAADLRMDEHNVFVPALWWVPDDLRLDDRAHIFDPPPPLVVEVRSPSTWRYDTGIKLRLYEARGCAEVWLVDGEDDVVVVHRRSAPDTPTFDVRLELAAGDVLSTPLIPGWDVDLGALFSC